MTKEELVKMYAGMTIAAIEKLIKETRLAYYESQKQMYFALYYLKVSGRWKENKSYAKSSFEAYLNGMYNIRIKTFEENTHVFMNFDKEAERFGVGVVAKVKHDCGAKQERKVLDAIVAADDPSKPINRSKIEAIIQKHKKQVVEKPVVPYIDWKNKYIVEFEAHKETKRLLAEAHEQIEKLKKTVLDLQSYRDMKKALQPFFVEVKGRVQPVVL
jgi:hypothetical protein